MKRKLDNIANLGIAVDFLTFDKNSVLAEALADRVACELSDAIIEKGNASLVVAGSRAFVLFFRLLSRAPVDWSKVTISLTDECYVPLTDTRSHEKFVRENLLQEGAEQANFVGLYNKAITCNLAAFQAANKIALLSQPFDVVVLDMGEDGHTASLVPGADRLQQALDINTKAVILPLCSKSFSEPRLTMTLPLLSSARFMAVYIEGQKKLNILQQALEENNESLPICKVLKHAAQVPHIYWAPREAKESFTTSDHWAQTKDNSPQYFS